MKFFVYRNTKTTLANWVPIHHEQPRGLAYETESHFVHLYGSGTRYWTISPGLTATEAKIGDLREWVESRFGAEDIEEAYQDVGTTIRGIWRPGIVFEHETAQGLGVTEREAQTAEQNLLLLLERVQQILLYVEPTLSSLHVYGHKLRELLLLSCMELEAQFKRYLREGTNNASQIGRTATRDYVRLKEPLDLQSFEVSMPRYEGISVLRPFVDWNADSPSRSLMWYDAYNRTKHDREQYFADASLLHCLNAVAANIVLFTVRYGPMRLVQGVGPLQVIFNQHFLLSLAKTDPKSFYAPLVNIPDNQRTDFICYSASRSLQPWIVKDFELQ